MKISDESIKIVQDIHDAYTCNVCGRYMLPEDMEEDYDTDCKYCKNEKKKKSADLEFEITITVKNRNELDNL